MLLNGLVKTWPKVCSIKEVLYIQEVNDVINSLPLKIILAMDMHKMLDKIAEAMGSYHF